MKVSQTQNARDGEKLGDQDNFNAIPSKIKIKAKEIHD